MDRRLSSGLFLLALSCSNEEPLPVTGNDPDSTSPNRCAVETESCAGFGSARPERLSEHASAYAPDRNELFVFGGTRSIPEQCEFPAPDYVGSTWIFSDACEKWRRVEASGPSARARSTAAYGNGSFWVFGGRFRAAGSTTGPYELFAELLAFDPRTDTWDTVPTGSVAPRARSDGAMVWDSTRSRLWLFGGNASGDALTYAPLDDVWTFDPESSSWTEQTTSGDRPAPRLQHDMLYDPVRDRVVVYGGSDESAFGPDALYSRALWALDLSTLEWLELDSGENGPGGRFWVSITYDAKRDGYLLFGGHDDGALGNRNDVWLFDPEGGGWQELSTGDVFNQPTVEFCAPPYDFATVDVASPERRSDHTFVYSERCERALVFAGKTDCGATDDVWAFDGGRWSELLTATEGEVCWRADGDPSACLGLCMR